MDCLNLPQPDFCRWHVPVHHCLIKMWKRCQTKVGGQAPRTFSCIIISAVASFRPYQLLSEFVMLSLSVLSLMLSFCRIRRHSLHMEHVTTDPHSSADQTKDLVNYEGRPSVLKTRNSIEPGDDDEVDNESREKIE